MLRAKDTLLLVVDFQGKLARIVQDSPAVLDAAGRLIRAARVLEVPILCTEQNPQGLGPTVPELAELLPPEGRAMPKFHFSCWRDPGIRQAMKDTGCKQDPAGRDRVARVRLPNRLGPPLRQLRRSPGRRRRVLADASQPTDRPCQGPGRGGGPDQRGAALFELLEVAQGRVQGNPEDRPSEPRPGTGPARDPWSGHFKAERRMEPPNRVLTRPGPPSWSGPPPRPGPWQGRSVGWLASARTRRQRPGERRSWRSEVQEAVW